MMVAPAQFDPEPTLPVELWPHNFIIFSTIMAIALGVLNPFTLPFTITASMLGVEVS